MSIGRTKLLLSGPNTHCCPRPPVKATLTQIHVSLALMERQRENRREEREKRIEERENRREESEKRREEREKEERKLTVSFPRLSHMVSMSFRLARIAPSNASMFRATNRARNGRNGASNKQVFSNSLL